MTVKLPYRVLHGLEDAQYNFEYLETHWPTGTGGGATGAAGGDLSGAYPNPSVSKVNGTTMPLTASAWIAPTLTNSWANVGSGYETAAYLKDPMGFVHLKGFISGGASGSTAFTLPAGYRPGATTNAAAGSSGTTTSGVQITTVGQVLPTFNAGGSAVGLTGVTFLAEN